MPQKKKRPPPKPAGPGLLQQYLTENFSSPPDTDLLNGHVLFMFVENDRSYPRTVQAIKERVAEPVVIRTTQLHKLVGKTIKKYKQLARESDRRNLDAVCCEKFVLGRQTQQEEELEEPENVSNAPARSSTPLDSNEPTTEMASTSQDPGSSQPSTTTKSLRGEPLTPRKTKLKKRLEFVTQSKSDIKKKNTERMKEVRRKLKKPDRMKHLNQVVKRKQAVIDKLRKHRAQKNKVTDYLDSLEKEKRDKLIKMAVSLGRKQRQRRRKRNFEIKEEISKRIALKAEKKEKKQN